MVGRVDISRWTPAGAGVTSSALKQSGPTGRYGNKEDADPHPGNRRHGQSACQAFCCDRGRDPGRWRRCRSGAGRGVQPDPWHRARFRLARRSFGLGRVRRGGQCHPRQHPPSHHHGRAQCRQACVLRKAAGDRSCQGHGNDRDGRAAGPREHGQSHLSQCRPIAEGARNRAVRRRGHGQAFRGELFAELAGVEGLGRLAHRKPVAVAPFQEARFQWRIGRYRRAYPRLRRLWRGQRLLARLLPARNLRQGAGQPDRRI